MANKMASWRFNRKIFSDRQRMMSLTKANERFCVLKLVLFLLHKVVFSNLVEECERLNEDLSQSQSNLNNINLNDESARSPVLLNNECNDSPVLSNDQIQDNFDNQSLPNDDYHATDESFISEDRQNRYVSCYRSILHQQGSSFSVNLFFLYCNQIRDSIMLPKLIVYLENSIVQITSIFFI